MQFKSLIARVVSSESMWEWVHPKNPGLFFQVLKRMVTCQKPDGVWTAVEPWYVFDRGSSVCALIHDIDTDMIVFTRQYRAGANEYLCEIPAGMLEVDEDPAVAVVREVFEETGYGRFISLKHLFSPILSPGGYTEQIHIFYIRVKSSDKTGTGGGLVAEGEFLEVLQIPANEAVAMIHPRNGNPPQVTDAKTIIALQYLENQRLNM